MSSRRDAACRSDDARPHSDHRQPGGYRRHRPTLCRRVDPIAKLPEPCVDHRLFRDRADRLPDSRDIFRTYQRNDLAKRPDYLQRNDRKQSVQPHADERRCTQRDSAVLPGDLDPRRLEHEHAAADLVQRAAAKSKRRTIPQSQCNGMLQRRWWAVRWWQHNSWRHDVQHPILRAGRYFCWIGCNYFRRRCDHRPSIRHNPAINHRRNKLLDLYLLGVAGVSLFADAVHERGIARHKLQHCRRTKHQLLRVG